MSNLGIWQEDQRSELELDVPPDMPIKFYDGRQLNPFWCWQKGTIAYQIEIQEAPVADMGLLTQEF